MNVPAASAKQRSRLLQWFLAAILVAFIAYRLLSPWTPLWIDLLFIAVGIVVLLALPKRSSGSADSKAGGA